MEEKKLTDEKAMFNYIANTILGEVKPLYLRKRIVNEILDLIHRSQEENKRLKDKEEEIRLFNLSLQNGEIDMSIESEMAKSFYNSIVQVFEQNGAKNFFTTTIDIEGKNGRYAFTIEKVGGQTVAEKLAEQEAEIERLTEKVENQKAVIKGQNKAIEKEKAENKRLYDEYVRLDDFCAGKGCICCVCENKKTCNECKTCGSLKTEKCKSFRLDVSKYARAIERDDKLQKQVDEYFKKAYFYYQKCKAYGIEFFYDDEFEAKPAKEGKTIAFPKFNGEDEVE